MNIFLILLICQEVYSKHATICLFQVKDKVSFEALIREVQDKEAPDNAPQPPDPGTAVEEASMF